MKFRGIASRLNAAFFERDRVVDGLLVAALAGEHVLMVGPPGTGKSALTRAFCSTIGGSKYFEWLLSKFTVPEELFGPLSIALLKLGAYSRVTDGKLPECHIAFLDEVFKANSGILNCLLTAINERIFHNGTQALEIPLVTLVGASNEFPDGSELSALYDRFMLRFVVEPLKSQSGRSALLAKSIPIFAEEVTHDEWVQAREEVKKINIPSDTVQRLLSLRQSLESAGISASDRRWSVAVKRVLRAAAWIEGDTEVLTDHFGVLADVLWSDVQQISKVQEMVGAIVSTEVSQSKVAFEALLQLEASAPKKSTGLTSLEQTSLVSLAREATETVKRIQADIVAANNSRHKSRLNSYLQKAQAIRESAVERVKEGFAI